MRPLFFACALGVLACGSPAKTEVDGTGGSSTDTGGSASGGKASGSASSGGETSDGGDGGETSSGGTSTGSSSSGGDASGGASGGTGGSETGGAGTGGSAEPSACNPPPITVFVGVGADQNNVCGWTEFNDPDAPEGYASIDAAIDCSNATSLQRISTNLIDNGEIRYNPWVEIIDPAERCTTGTMAGVDRRFTFTSGFCVKVSSPFSGFKWNGSSVTGNCGVTSTSETPISIVLGEQGWVKVETAALEGVSNCSLTCP